MYFTKEDNTISDNTCIYIYDLHNLKCSEMAVHTDDKILQ